MRLYLGDCLDILPTLPEAGVAAIVTDPPYDLTSPVATRRSAFPGRYAGTAGAGRGFMGKEWDGTGIAFRVELWAEALRVLKPGGYLLAFGGTRTYHRMAVAIEDAGFVIKDSIHWLYSTGFPKSLQVTEAMKKAGTACKCEGSALPYTHELGATSEHNLRPVRSGDLSSSFDAGDERGQVLLAGLPERGAPAEGEQLPDHAGGEQSSLEGRHHLFQEEGQLLGSPLRASAGMGATDGASGRLCHGASPGDGADDRALARSDRGRPSPGSQAGQQSPEQPRTVADQQQPQTGGAWPHCGRCGLPIIPPISTALKPAHEPIVVAQKPLAGTYAANVAAWGVGGLDIDGTRVGTPEDKRAAGSKRYTPSQMAGKEPGDGEGVRQPAPHDGLGRWPPNLVLTHAADCRPLGTRRVKGSNPPGPGRTDGPKSQAIFGTMGDNATFHYADADGLETVEAWDCAPSCPVAALDRQSGERQNGGQNKTSTKPNGGMFFDGRSASRFAGDTGGASRFYPVSRFEADDFAPFLYQAKASRSERTCGGTVECSHPTVKPIALMRWLVRLVTPPGETVLDPFAGSGTTGIACVQEGRDFIGIERDAAYFRIAENRIARAQPALFAAVAD